MQWSKVESSNVAEVAYDPDIRAMGVRYRDGSTYIRPNVSPDTWAALQASSSPGKFLARLAGTVMLVERGCPEERVTAQPEQRGAPHAVDAPLIVIDEEADACCRKAVAAFLRQWPKATTCCCDKCGTDFVFDPKIPGVRYFGIKAAFSVFRR
jgi:hypothetical protein